MPLTGGPRKGVVETDLRLQGIELPEWHVTQEVIKANLQGIEVLAPLIHERFGKGRLTLPHMIGSGRDQWTQQDYNTLWTYYVAGVPSEAAWHVLGESPILSRYLTLRGEIPSTERREAYRQIREEFLGVVRRNAISLRPVGHLVQMPGYEESHGATNEGEIATALGIPRSKIVFNAADHRIQRLAVEDPMLRDSRYSRHEKGKPPIILERIS
jgi:hypothetical protein